MSVKDSYIGRVMHLRIASIVATIIYLGLTTAEFIFEGKIIPTYVTEAYLFIVGTYAANNTRLKSQCLYAKRSSGEVYVYVFWIYFGILSIFCFFNPSVEISFHLFEATTGVTGIFCLSTFYNIRHIFKQ